MAKVKKKNSTLKRILLLLVVFIIGVVGIVAGVFLGSINKLRKNADAITAGITEDYFRSTEASIIYDIHGQEITSISGMKELYYVEDDNIPEILKKAFVTVEDQDFYSHHGILSHLLKPVKSSNTCF